MEFILSKFNYWIYVVLMMIGLYAMISKNNLVKKLIGMSIFQTAIILFYVSIGVKTGATIPIVEHHAAINAEQAVQMAFLIPEAHAKTQSHTESSKKELHKPKDETHHGKDKTHHESSSSSDNHADPGGEHSSHGDHATIQAKDYNNPLPHVLMLTAIVVGVATLGVGLAVVQKIYMEYGSAEESEILAMVRQENL